MINKTHPLKIELFIVAVASILFIPFLGGVHLFDWDEINFAEAAREMIVTKNYLTVQINFLPFWEKPPLFIWMQVLSMKVFGINEFAARFPNAICGVLTLLVIFKIGRRIHHNLFGLLWVLAFAGSVLPFFYFKSGIIDPWFNLFIFLGVYFLVLYSSPENTKRKQNIFFAATFAGFAILTKGPVGFLLIALTAGVFLILVRFKVKVKITEVLLYFLILALVGGSWFIIQILTGHYDTVVEFIVYQIRLFQTQDAGHGGFFAYHFVMLFFTVFPTSILALKSFKRENINDDFHRLMKKWMLILFWVVLILFSIVKTKIVHYSSLAYFPLTFLAANFVYRASENKQIWKKWISGLLIFVAVLFALPVIMLPFVDKIKNKIIAKNWIHDQFTVGNLQATANWNGFEFIPGIFLVVSVILILVRIPKTDVLKRAIYLWGTTLIFTFFVITLVVPKVEKYSQNALIEFFKSHAEEDIYLKNIYFRSYATYFYGETTPPQNKNFYDEKWLLTGNIDKDVYFVTKIHRAQRLEEYQDIKKIGEKNGFVFFKREAK
ncbi:ArnT family glycosyltransferase [Maribellus maritimus]|uniref:ArnT family glycosyltransferase n=1 Tax=Maribellus maritimus TaxID=2870838 RepID=UPI001EEA1342|nr:glycosyltransferase family 39 protein [Maribellus maritimus]MCG6187803.1 glycosyltransferase family 39 protein [Maribellus maritimus]